MCVYSKPSVGTAARRVLFIFFIFQKACISIFLFLVVIIFINSFIYLFIFPRACV